MLMLGSGGGYAYAVADSDTGASAIRRHGGVRASHSTTFAAHVHVLCMLFGVTPDSDRWVDAPMSPARVFTCLPRCAAIIDCGGPRAFLQCTPICAFLSRRIDRRSLFPSQSSLLLTANTSLLVSRLIKPSYALFQTSLPPSSTTRTLHIHASPSRPAKRNHSLPAPIKQTLTNRQHGQGKQAFTLVHASALAAQPLPQHRPTDLLLLHTPGQVRPPRL